MAESAFDAVLAAAVVGELEQQAGMAPVELLERQVVMAVADQAVRECQEPRDRQGNQERH